MDVKDNYTLPPELAAVESILAARADGAKG